MQYARLAKHVARMQKRLERNARKAQAKNNIKMDLKVEHHFNYFSTETTVINLSVSTKFGIF